MMLLPASPLARRFWVMPESFTTPAPLRVKVMSAATSMVKALAPGLKTILLTWVAAEIVTLVIFESPKVATSFGPLGTVAGVQLRALLHCLLVGLRFHVALPASLARVVRSKAKAARRAAMFS